MLCVDCFAKLRPAKEAERKSQATVLVGLALEAGVKLFHSPDGRAFAHLPIADHFETWPLRSKAVKHWLALLYYEATDKVPGSQATADALGALEGRARFRGPEEQVFTRVAAHGGATYLDLADPDWRVVKITAQGWDVVASAPVHFVVPPECWRCRCQPMEVRWRSCGNLNYASENDFRLMICWLAMTLRASGPYPVLALHGEQGSGKSTTAEMLRMLVDPNKALLRPPSRDERDLVIAGSNGRVIALENISGISQWLSDALCRISTGSGFSTRELYTDADEAIFAVQLPIILNGIVEVIARGDLQDRSIVITLPRITRYCSEAELWKKFLAACPRLLGALLDVASIALRNEPRA